MSKLLDESDAKDKYKKGHNGVHSGNKLEGGTGDIVDIANTFRKDLKWKLRIRYDV